MKMNLNISTIACAVFGILFISACSDLYNLPEDKDFISEDIDYSSKVLEPVIGRTSIFHSLNSQNSTLPLEFEIVNARYGDGRPVKDIFTVVPVYEWISEYDGEETSLEEIEQKRRKVERPIFEVDSYGRLIFWGASNNELIEPRPQDTVLKAQEVRFFDLKVTNTGGSRIIKDFQIIPWTERAYSPSTDINPYTGGVAPDPQFPKDPSKQDYILPSRMSGVLGENSNESLLNNEDRKDLVVYIRKYDDEVSDNSTLRFKFMDKEGEFINPALFNETKWDELVHGFNRKTTDEYVQYDVAYPIPLTNIKTPYVNGDKARVTFSYSRKGWGGVLHIAEFGLDFKIYKPGNWEIVFHFRRENPKFDND